MQIDKDFDYWSDVNPGMSPWDAKVSKDPDSVSKPLQAAHKTLWTKKLPNGAMFNLQPARGAQLQWQQFRLSSDSISNSYMTNGRMREILLQAQDHAEELFYSGTKIGAFILFPAYQVERKITINAARGIIRKIEDRMDLTLEAIRRHYAGDESPLTDVLDRYADFFELFVSFEGYVDFWMLNDLIDNQYRVRFFLPFDDYTRNGGPVDLDEYIRLKTETVRFLSSRTVRIAAHENMNPL